MKLIILFTIINSIYSNEQAHQNNLKNRGFGKEDSQNLCSEEEIIAEWQGSSENKNSEANPMQPRTDSSSCFGINQIVNRYGYLSFGIGPLPFPVPILGGGYRIQKERYGFDISGNALVVAPERGALKFSVLFLHYFSPQQKWYIGAGGQITQVFDLDWEYAGHGISPEFSVGREYSTNGKKRFFQLSVDYPIYTKDHHTYKLDPTNLYYFPYLFFQYGLGF